MSKPILTEKLFVHSGRIRVEQTWINGDVTVTGTRSYCEEIDKNLPYKEKRKKKSKT